MGKFFFIGVIILLFFLTQLWASPADEETYKNQQELIKGESEGITVMADGTLMLSNDVGKIFSGVQPFIWDMAVDSKQRIFIATGVGASIIKLQKSENPDTLAVWQKAEVYALALDNKNRLYAALSPGGQIYRFDRNLKPELWVNLNVAYVWDLLFDEKDNLFAATGDSGIIFKIGPDGKFSPFFHSEEIHVRSLAFDPNAQLLAGTYKNGYIFSINSSGEGFVVHDCDFEEVSQLAVTEDHTIYAVAMSRKEAAAKAAVTKPQQLSMGEDFSLESIVISTDQKPDLKALISGGIIKITADGAVKNIWGNRDDEPHSLFFSPSEKLLYVGTGEKGRLYHIDREDEVSLIDRFAESQIVGFHQAPKGGVYLATSNMSAVYQIETELRTSGVYVSPTIDAVARSLWGTIHYDAEGSDDAEVLFFTRSGNTKLTNKTWSPWIKAKPQDRYVAINSPRARFLQWKLQLNRRSATTGPVVKNVRVSYLQQNLPPEIISLVVHPVAVQPPPAAISVIEPIMSSIKSSGDSSDDDPMSRLLGREMLRQPERDGFRKISWKARDLNKDKLIYELQIRYKQDRHWWTLKKEVASSSFVWDTRKFPDGIYQIKLIASDHQSNPINVAKTTEKLSERFIIDNTGPQVEKLKISKKTNDSLQIAFIVKDQLSVIKEVHYSINGDDWNWVNPVDLVCDSKREEFVFQIKKPAERNHTLVIRAKDDANNVGYGRIVFGE
ncbi:MAG: hypothetical protein SCK70_00890 [bacterium]|nr:hypothetical protein [bacterium]